MPNEFTLGNGTSSEAIIHVIITIAAIFSPVLILIAKNCFIINDFIVLVILFKIVPL